MTVIIFYNRGHFIGEGKDLQEAMYDAILMMIAEGEIEDIQDFVKIKDECEVHELGKQLTVSITIPDPIITIY